MLVSQFACKYQDLNLVIIVLEFKSGGDDIAWISKEMDYLDVMTNKRILDVI